jgi:antitoxin component HigA of HigAB toxin-antitoxin module
MITIDDKYFDCVRQFPLVEIDDDNYDQAVEMLASLMHRQLTAGECAYKKLLEHLIKEHEKPHADGLENIEPHELLAGLMELHGLNQTKLAEVLECRQSYISAMLRKDKPISDATAVKLGKYFAVNPNKFLRKIPFGAVLSL